ncbi:hypothetical protein NN561_008948 [Cricetulus griseus]
MGEPGAGRRRRGAQALRDPGWRWDTERPAGESEALAHVTSRGRALGARAGLPRCPCEARRRGGDRPAGSAVVSSLRPEALTPAAPSRSQEPLAGGRNVAEVLLKGPEMQGFGTHLHL